MTTFCFHMSDEVPVFISSTSCKSVQTVDAECSVHFANLDKTLQPASVDKQDILNNIRRMGCFREGWVANRGIGGFRE